MKVLETIENGSLAGFNTLFSDEDYNLVAPLTLQRSEPHTLDEFKSKICDTCGASPYLCVCFAIPSEILDDMQSFSKGLSLGELQGTIQVRSMLQGLFDYDWAKPCYGVLAPHRMRKIVLFTEPEISRLYKAIGYLSLGPNKIVEDYIKFLMQNPKFLYFCFLSGDLKLIKIIKTLKPKKSEVKRSKNERPLQEIKRIKKVVPDNLFVNRKGVKIDKQKDYDLIAFLSIYNVDKYSGNVRGLKAPPTMKQSFVRNIIEKTAVYTPDLAPIPYRFGAILDNVKKYNMGTEVDEIDVLTSGLFDCMIQTLDMRQALKLFSFRLKNFTWPSVSHDALYRFAIGLERGLPDFHTDSSFVDVFRQRYNTSFDEMLFLINKEYTLQNLLNCTSFHKFTNAFRAYITLQNTIRVNTGYRKIKRVVNLNQLVSMYATECTNYFLQPTMFSFFSKANNASDNIVKLDVDSINAAVKKAYEAASGTKLASDQLNDILSGVDPEKIKRIIDGVDKVSNSSNAFLSFIVNPLYEQVMEQVQEFTQMPMGVLDKLRERITPLNMMYVTWYTICYQKTSSNVMKTLYACIILERLSLLGEMIVWLHFFLNKTLEFSKKVLDWAHPTSPMDIVTQLMSCLTMKPIAISFGIISTLLSMLGQVVNPSVVMSLLKTAANFGRNLFFIERAVDVAPKLWETIAGSFKAVIDWYNGKVFVSPEDDWLTKYDNWAIQVVAHDNPRYLDILRTDPERRKKVHELYEVGLELMKEKRGKEPLRKYDIPLGRYMKIIKDLTAQVVKFDAYTSSRTTPYHIVLTADAGVGKTNFVHSLAEAMRLTYWPDIAQETCVYNVPTLNTHMDGYSKQPIMLLDDYNIIDDPLIMAKIVYLVSNIPYVLPMAELSDKGIVNESKMIISTTNNPYFVSNGVVCKEALLRRRKWVVEMSVDQRYKIRGNLSKNSIIQTRLKYITQKFRVDHDMNSEDILDEEDSSVLLARAEAFYNRHSYFTFTLKDPIHDKIASGYVMNTEQFIRFILTDYAKHVEQERALLAHNARLPVQFDEIALLSNVNTLLQERLEQVQVETEAADSANILERVVNVHPLVSLIDNLNTNIKIAVSCFPPVIAAVGEYFSRLPVFAATPPPPLAPEAPPEEDVYSLARNVNFDEPLPTAMNYIASREVNLEVDNGEGIAYYALPRFPLTLGDVGSDDDELLEDPPRFGYMTDEILMHDRDGEQIDMNLATDFMLRLRPRDPGVMPALRSLVREDSPVHPDAVDWVLAYQTGNLPDHVDGRRYLYDSGCDWFHTSCYIWTNLPIERQIALYDAYKLASDYTANFEALPVQVGRIARLRRGIGAFFYAFAPEILTFVFVILYFAVYLGLIYAVIWLFSPETPCATINQYSQEPKRHIGLNTGPLRWSATMGEYNVIELRKRFCHNMQVMERTVSVTATKLQISRVQILYVAGCYALVPAHFFPLDFKEMEVTTSTPEGLQQPHIITSQQVYRFQDRDAVLVELNGGTRYHRSLVKHFIEEKAIDTIVGTNMAIYKRDMDGTLLACSTRIRERTRIDLPGLVNLDSFIYGGTVEVGSSGGAIMSTSPSVSAAFLGIQSASAATWGAFSPLTREQILVALSHFDAPLREEIPDDYETSFDTTELKWQTTQAINIFDNARIVAVAPPSATPYTGHKTALRHTPIGTNFPCTRQPAVLNDYDKRFKGMPADSPHYLKKSMTKFCRDVMQPLTEEEKKAAVLGSVQMYRESGVFNDLRLLNMFEAIEGIAPYTNKIDVNTSPGLPWVLEPNRRPGKKSLISFSEDGVLQDVRSDLIKKVSITMNKMRDNIIPHDIIMDSVKDELRDAELNKQFQARTINVLPVHWSIVARMHFLSYYAAQNQLSRQGFPVSVGINIASHHAKIIVENICSRSKGSYCFDMDISNWDGHCSPDYFDMLVRKKNMLYNDGIVNARVRKLIYEFIQFAPMQFSHIVYQPYRGMKSGSVGTANDNSDIHCDLLYIVYRRIMLSNFRPDLATFSKFRENVVFFVYGDDMIVSVHENAAEYFDGETVARGYLKLGWPTTPATKGDTLVKFKHWTELTYLKRHFVWDVQRSIVLTPIQLEVIYNLWSYYRANDSNSIEFLYSNIKDSVALLSHHPPTVFQQYITELNVALVFNYLPPIFPTWEGERNDFFMSYYQD